MGLGLASGASLSQADCTSKEPLGKKLEKDLEVNKLKEILRECQQTANRCVTVSEKSIAMAKKERVSHNNTIEVIEKIKTRAGDCCLEGDFRKRMSCYYGKVSGPIDKHIRNVRPNRKHY